MVSRGHSLVRRWQDLLLGYTPRMPTLKAVLFDFDGTLVSSTELLCDIFNECLVEQGVEPASRESLRRMLGEPLDSIFRKLTNLVDVDRFNKSFQEKEVGRHTTEHIALVRDTKPTLEFLREQNYQLGIVTTKETGPVTDLLVEYQLKDLFGVIIGRDQVKQPKPDPEPVLLACERLEIKPAEALFVGDSLLDLTAAKEAGSIFVGVLTGACNRQEFEQNKADYIFSHVGELVELVRHLKD